MHSPLTKKACKLEESLRAHQCLLAAQFKDLVKWVCRRLAVITKSLTAQGGGWMWDGRIKMMQGDEVVAWLKEQNMGKKAVDELVHRGERSWFWTVHCC